MSEDLTGQAKRVASAYLAESGIVGANDEEYDRLVSVMALLWLNGFGAGVQRVETIAAEVLS